MLAVEGNSDTDETLGIVSVSVNLMDSVSVFCLGCANFFGPFESILIKYKVSVLSWYQSSSWSGTRSRFSLGIGLDLEAWPFYGPLTAS